LYISEGTKKEQQVVVRTIQDIDRAIHHWSMTNYDAYSRAARAQRQAELLAKQAAAEEKDNTMMRKRVLFSP
jgi:multidrug efflux pump subunit AcrA (membrane-fusion protein)